MATTNNKGALPEGFVSPFKRVAQEDRFDDALASVAILTSKSLAEVRKQAEQYGLPKTGPYWLDIDMIAKLLMNLGGLVATDYKEVTSIDALPDVAILLVQWDARTEVGRHVVFHHIRGSKDQAAFHYVVDPAFWIPEHQQVTTEFSHLAPAWYISVTATKSGVKGK
jgi:hypothetical protein